MTRRARRVYLAAGFIGLVCTAVGVFESYRLFRLISLEREGKCDFVPCADSGAYLWLGAFLVITIFGVATLSAALIRERRPPRGLRRLDKTPEADHNSGNSK